MILIHTAYSTNVLSSKSNEYNFTASINYLLNQEIEQIFNFEEWRYWEMQNPRYGCLEDSLKNVTLYCFAGSANEMKLVELLLEKARVLEKMDVFQDRAKNISTHLQTLRNFPRRSPKAHINFC